MKKKHVFYLFWSLGVLAFFLYWLFPSEEIKKYIEYRVKNAGTGYSLGIGDIRPALPPGLTLFGIEVRKGDSPVLEADQIKIMPRFLSLFGSSPAIAFHAMLCDGTVKGESILQKESGEKGEGKNLRVNAVLSGIQIKQIQGLQNLSGHQIAGSLQGTVEYSGNDSAGSGNADITVRELTVEMGTPLFSIGKLTFADVSAKMILENMQNLQIKECTVKGNQVGGNMSGTVGLKNPPEKSILNLAGVIKPHPSLIAQMGEGMSALLLKSNRSKSEFPFKLRGTLEKPEFSMQ